MGYAEQTFVPIERTKAEIEMLLVKSGCDAIATLWDKREAPRGDPVPGSEPNGPLLL